MCSTTAASSSDGRRSGRKPRRDYLALSGAREAELVASALPANASILELGCGTGRVTHELIARGFSVTAVDESAEMLEHVRDAEKVHARIEELDLVRRFDCVLLASHFVNAPDADVFLDACARHVDGNGVVLVEAYPPDREWAVGRVTRVGRPRPWVARGRAATLSL
jgi:SAM-dependent methyltransferase